MLAQRLILAAALIAPILGVCWLDWHLGFRQPLVWLPVALLLAAVSLSEILDLVAARDIVPVQWPVYVGTLAVVAAAFAPAFWPLCGVEYPPACPLGKLGWPLLALALGLLLVFLAEMARFAEPGRATMHVAVATFALVYVGLLTSFLGALRMLAVGSAPAWGMLALFSAIFTAKMCDGGGFIVGKLLGRTRLAPILSPTKTVEGAVVGVLFAVLASWLTFDLIAPEFVALWPRLATPWWSWLSFGLAVAAAAMLGDLAESLLKRDMERKDAGNWIPAFGGALDVLDSILAAAPVAFLFWAAGIVGP